MTQVFTGQGLSQNSLEALVTGTPGTGKGWVRDGSGGLVWTDLATQAELDAVAAAKQDVDSDLTAIAGLTPANDDFMQRKGGAWTNRTIAQVQADLGASAGVAQARAKISGVVQYSIPGVYPTGTTTFTAVNNRAMYFPFLVMTAMTIDQIVVELTTGQAASTCRAAIYPADTDWQPTTLVANTDTGTFATAAANQGVIATTITDTVLAAGRYLFWLNASAASIVFRAILSGASSLLGYPVALGSNTGFSQIFIAQTYGAPPSTGLAWTGASVANPNSFSNPVWIREKTP